jgi:ribosomal protein S18 acetylase RimI-like enzyme
VTQGFIVEPLGAGHDRTVFSCGVAALDRYFRELVTQDVRRRVSNCFVALDPAGTIAAYYTFGATSIPLAELLPDEVKRLPRYPLLPAGLVGRLAVDGWFRGRGLGSSLVVDAVVRAMRAEPAIFSLVVNAKDDTAAEFYAHHGFQRFASHPMTLYLPIAEAARRLGSLPGVQS